MTVNVQKRRSYRITRIRRAAPYGQAAIPPSRRLYILLTMIAAAGVFIGAYSFVCTGGTAPAFPLHDFKGTFLSSFTAVSVYIIICFFSGFSSAGQPVGYLLCFFKGTGAGYLSACILGGGMASADPVQAMNILPFEAVSMVAVILAARENIKMSALTAARTFGNAEQSGEAALRLYFLKFLLIFAIAAAGAACDAMISLVNR